jgi:hypothetical protein
MTSVLQSPEDICNAALVRLGYKKTIGNIYEGSMASRIFLRIYGQTRDAQLRASDWGFAEGIAAGVVAGIAPFPWLYQYAYPGDCLKVRDIFNQQSYAGDQNNPTPNDWRTGNALINNVSQEVVWANIVNATLVYTRQVTSPAAWTSDFAEGLIAALARRALPAFQEAQLLPQAAKDEETMIQIADATQG